MKQGQGKMNCSLGAVFLSSVRKNAAGVMGLRHVNANKGGTTLSVLWRMLFFRSFMIKGKRVSLIEMSMEHKEDLFEIFSNADSTRYWLSHCDTMEELERMLRVEYLSYRQRGLPSPYVIWYESKAIGVCNFNEENEGVGRIGFILNVAYEHLGLMQEALQLLCEMGFSIFGYHRIEALVFHDNIKSKNTLLHSGFVYEGTMRSYLKFENNLEDIDLFSKIQEEEHEKTVVSKV